MLTIHIPEKHKKEIQDQVQCDLKYDAFNMDILLLPYVEGLLFDVEFTLK